MKVTASQLTYRAPLCDAPMGSSDGRTRRFLLPSAAFECGSDSSGLNNGSSSRRRGQRRSAGDHVFSYFPFPFTTERSARASTSGPAQVLEGCNALNSFGRSIATMMDRDSWRNRGGSVWMPPGEVAAFMISGGHC